MPDAMMDRLPMPNSVTARFDGPAIALHWLTALLVVSMYALGQLWDLPAHGSALASGMKSLHYSLGAVLAVVLVARIAWRSTHRAPPESAPGGLMTVAAQAGHLVLYALLIAEVALGLTLRWTGGRTIGVFGLFDIPPLVALGADWRHTLFGWHALAANGLLIVAAGHAAAALFHQYVLRDGVLSRMMPAGRSAQQR